MTERVWLLKELKEWLETCDDSIALSEDIVKPLVDHYNDLLIEKMKNEVTK